MRKLFFILFLICPFFFNAQVLNEDDLGFYREDQLYFGFSFISLDANNKYFKQNGLSSHFQLGFVRDIPLISSGKFAIGLGVGYSFQQFNSNIIRVGIDNENSIFTVNNNNSNFEKSLLSINIIEFPISLRWRNSSIKDYQFWRVYTGIKFQRNFFSKLKINNGDSKNISKEINNWNKDLYLSFGYNTWNFYFSYGLNQIIKNLKIQDSNKLFKVKPFKIGLIFYLL